MLELGQEMECAGKIRGWAIFMYMYMYIYICKLGLYLGSGCLTRAKVGKFWCLKHKVIHLTRMDGLVLRCDWNETVAVPD